MPNNEAAKLQWVNPDRNRLWQKCFLVLMFLLAVLVRRDEIKAPGHLIEREYNSAIYARAFYFSDNDDVESWRKDIAFAARDQLPMLEPPLTEYLVSLMYRLANREEIWFARYLTSLFWLIGGIFLYKTIQALASSETALIGVGYYLFVPWGIIISRSFQPDALMMMMFMVSLHFIILYYKESSWGTLIAASIITGMTLLIRPLVIFSLFGAFIFLSIHFRGKWVRIFDKQLIVFLSLSLIFPLTFYGYGIFVAGFLQGQADLSFRPFLLLRWEFWQGWFNLGTRVVGHSFLLLGILGFFALRDKLTRFMVAGLAAGYFIFGLFFTYHIHTHPYYHIQVFPIIAICIGPLFVRILQTLKRTTRQHWLVPVAVVFFIAVYFSWSEERNALYTAVFEDPNLAWEIGEAVDHSPRTVFVAYHYGLPLEYYGELAGAPWPVRIDDPFYRSPDARELSVQERLNGLGFTPEYFVITNFDLFNRKHQDLQTYLIRNCSPLKVNEAYLIYDNCGKIGIFSKIWGRESLSPTSH